MLKVFWIDYGLDTRSFKRLFGLMLIKLSAAFSLQVASEDSSGVAAITLVFIETVIRIMTTRSNSCRCNI
jgi:hypothetical protein